MKDLHALYEGLELPEGYRAEIIDGSIVVSPTPSYLHAETQAVIQEILMEGGLRQKGLRVMQPVTVLIPETEECYVPDFIVFRKDVLKQGDRGAWKRSAEGAELALEVVSPSSRVQDWRTKAAGYARAQIPLYLVADPLKEKLALFSAPGEDGYIKESTLVGDDALYLPAPFDLEIRASDVFELD